MRRFDRGRRLLRRMLGLEGLQRSLDETKVLAARAVLEQRRGRGPVDDLREVELQVFSQFGDDGIIQYLVREAEVSVPAFVEIGVEDYTEANTRFLLVHDGWRGMVVDCVAECVAAIRAHPLRWRDDLTPVEAMVEPGNVDELLVRHGFAGDLGLLSIDVDGNDYWVWEALGAATPTIVVVEYNALFGRLRQVSIPYQAGFRRLTAHSSGLYWGASLAAFCALGARKGYAFVGCNSAGNNAYFVRRERLGRVRPQDPQRGWRDARFRESRGPDGALTFLGGAARVEAIRDMPLLDLETGRMVRVGEVSGGA